MSLEKIHGLIKKNIDALERGGIDLSEIKSDFFNRNSFGEIVDKLADADSELNKAIRIIQSKIDEIFS